MSRVMMDSRYMVNAKPLKGALKALDGAKTVVYETMDALNARKQYGVTGQSIEEQLPCAVEVDGLGNRYVKPEQLVAVLVAAVKELSARVAKLEGEKKSVAKAE